MPFLNALFLIVLLFSSPIVQADSQLKLQPLQTLVKESFTSLIPDPKNPDVLYGITPVNVTYIPQGGHLYKSTDRGAHWTLLVFNGGYRQLVIDPFNSDVFYAIQEMMENDAPIDRLAHVLKSVDGGKTWTLLLTDNINLFTPRYNAVKLFLFPLSQNTLYVFLYNKLYRSDNGGSSWKEITSPITKVVDIAISPTDPQGLFFITKNNQLFRSNDAGLTWQIVQHNIVLEKQDETYWINTTFKSLWTSSKQANVLYMDISRGYYTLSKNPPPLDSAQMKDYVQPDETVVETYKSHDSGQTWQIIPKPQITACQATLPACYAGLFYIDPYHKDVLYSAAHLYTYLRGYKSDRYSSVLYRSQDDGNTWDEILQIKERTLSAVLSHPQKQETSYVSMVGGQIYSHFFSGQLLLTENTGKTWTELDSTFKAPVSLTATAVDPSNPKIFYAIGENWTIYQTVDGGQTFTALPSFTVGISNYVADDIIDSVISVTENALFGRAHRWMDQQWQLYLKDILDSHTNNGSAVQFVGSDIYLTVSVSETGNFSKILYFRSRDNAVTWSPLNLGAQLPYPKQFVANPTQKNILYFYFRNSHYDLPTGQTQPGVYQSVDDGETWQDISGDLPISGTNAEPYQFIPHPTQNQTLYFSYDGSLHKTVDNGKTWKVVGGGVIPHEEFKLWFDPNNSQTMYAMLTRTSDPRFLYKSTDAGETWRNVSLGLQEENSYTVTYEALRFAPNSGKIIYLARAKERMYQSEDGEHWEIIIDAARLERESPTGMLLSFSLPDMKFKGAYRVENIGNAVSASLINYPLDKNYDLTNSPDNIKVQVAEHADQSMVNLKRTEAVTVQAKFEINNIAAYEQPAAFFVVARYQPLDSSDAYWFMQTEDKQWLAWDGNIENLKPAKLVNQLQPTESLDIFTGMPNGVARTTSIYAGYRPSSPTYIPTTISNQNSPLVLKIE